MLRRLHHDQPQTFAFTQANREWAAAQVAKYPEGRQASAVIPLLWRAQEQEGWLSRPAIEEVAWMLGMPTIRVLEVATFYFMFQLSPVGSVAHIQICGTTPCMLSGAEDLVKWCQRNISPEPHHPSPDGRFSWEEVECLGACANAPMAQIGKDYYEDLTIGRLRAVVDELAQGRVPQPGPQGDRFASEPEGALTSLTQWAGEGRNAHNASVELALAIGDTVKRIDGTEVPFRAPWLRTGQEAPVAPVPVQEATVPTPAGATPVDASGISVQQAPADSAAKPPGVSNPDKQGAIAAPAPEGAETGVTRDPEGSTAGGTDPAPEPSAHLVPEVAPALLTGPRGGVGDDLKRLNGVGPKLERLLHELGIWHFDQIAGWGPGELAWVNSRLGGFRGRAERDDWIGQARKLTGL